MEKTYAPEKIESAWYQQWESNGYFAPSGSGTPYAIMIPPPNVTGSLHMGHAFQDTIMDSLTRYHRMKGHNTLWQAGSDHAGIATQMVVERQLNAEGIKRSDLGREEFLERVWQWKGESGGTISRQLRRLGTSLDWEHERFTMDAGLSEAVLETFVRLHEEDLIYRGKRLVNWDPKLKTAVSDLEVISEEEDGFLWHLRYPLSDGSGHVVVATTRPETMLGDSAVAVHPDDERYAALIGKTIDLPLCNRAIPVIADDYVEREFGSGCVKITPAHDFNDAAVGARHDLEIINVFTEDAAINDNAPAAYRGMDRYDARKRIIEDLTSLDLVERIEPHRLMVPRGDRTQSVIEPLLTDQWFVRAQPLAEPAIAAVENGNIKFVPANWDKTYFEWMRNIEDWCISRQIWWGHRIPAWYDNAGNVYVGRSEEEVRAKHELGPELALRQDDDVLDTWFSSALWPFSTLGWPADTERVKTFYPTSVLVTGFDIIFFWVARMIMMGIKFMGDVPFREVYIHGLVRDADGNKMSKSKGNILDPLDLIDGIELEPLLDKRTTGLMQPELAPRIREATLRQFPDGIGAYGTDALRFTFCSLATTGRDIRFDMGRIEGYRNFCNKLWNAARFVLMHTDGHDCSAPADASAYGVEDRWILSALQRTTATVTESIESYRLDLAAQAMYEFTWNEYCDWYLELAKPGLNDADASPAQRQAKRHTLVTVLESILRLIHPVMPFITEEIWQRVNNLADKNGPTVMTQPYPQSDAARIDEEAEQTVEWVRQFVLGVRRIRGEMDIAPNKKLPILLQGGGSADEMRVAEHRVLLDSLCRVESLEWLGADATAPECATALLGDLRIMIPLEGVIDVRAAIARTQKALAKESKDYETTATKLSNPKFVERAPADVVAKERERMDTMTNTIKELESQLARLKAMK
ncbi:MAG: valine--tRNA ligase [Gammaproteobacteria bacterium]|nr:valine--tRNA ligase [Gammaproteobacteria bacterium]